MMVPDELGQYANHHGNPSKGIAMSEHEYKCIASVEGDPKLVGSIPKPALELLDRHGIVLDSCKPDNIPEITVCAMHFSDRLNRVFHVNAVEVDHIDSCASWSKALMWLGPWDDVEFYQGTVDNLNRGIVEDVIEPMRSIVDYWDAELGDLQHDLLHLAAHDGPSPFDEAPAIMEACAEMSRQTKAMVPTAIQPEGPATGL